MHLPSPSRLFAAAALALVLVGPRASLSHAEDPPERDRAARGAPERPGEFSPFENERLEAARRAGADATACRLAETRRQDPRATVRLHAWLTLAAATEPVALEIALGGARDPDARVAALAAAEVWRTLADPRAGVRLPAAAKESAAARRALAYALRNTLARTRVNAMPMAVFYAGPEVAQYLADVVAQPSTEVSLRVRILDWLSRLGSEEAADVILSFLETRTSGLPVRDLWGAITAMPLTQIQQARLMRIVQCRGGGPAIPWRKLLASRGWARTRHLDTLLTLLARHAPDALRETLTEAARDILRTGRAWPPRLLAATRMLVAHDALSLDDQDVLLDRCDSRVQLRGREAELASVLAVTESAWKDADARSLLLDMLDRADPGEEEAEITAGFTKMLPKTVEAWARYLAGEEGLDLVPLAEALVFGSGRGLPVWSARRLGARLWRRLPPPSPAQVRDLFVDPDPWMRREAFAWLGRLPKEEHEPLRQQALVDSDDSVFLVGLEQGRRRLDEASTRRAVELALTGREGQRLRAWQALERRAWPAKLAPRSAFTEEPRPGRRVDLAAAILASLESAPRKGPGEGLPAGGDR